MGITHHSKLDDSTLEGSFTVRREDCMFPSQDTSAATFHDHFLMDLMIKLGIRADKIIAFNNRVSNFLKVYSLSDISSMDG